MQLEQLGSTTVAFYDGPLIASEEDGLDLIGTLYGLEVDLLAIPAGSLADDFYRLRTGLAGAILQKFQNYRLRVAIVGDISRWTKASAPLRDFIRETTRRGEVLFVAHRKDLAERL